MQLCIPGRSCLVREIAHQLIKRNKWLENTSADTECREAVTYNIFNG